MIVFPDYGRSPHARAHARILPHTIYTNQNHKNHAGFSNFYNLEQKGLLFEEIQEDSTSFVTGRVITRIEQKGLKNKKNSS